MHFHLELDERQADRVFVTVCLAPPLDAEGGVVDVQGVALELRTRAGEALGPRLLLPVAGVLTGPITLSTEVRSRTDLPRGSRVHGLVWWEGGQVETASPTDPGTALESFARGGGSALTPLDPDDLPVALTETEWQRLSRAFPWMRNFRRDGEHVEDRILEEQPEDLADDIADCYGLCDEDRDLLQELLGEDDLDDLDGFSALA